LNELNTRVELWLYQDHIRLVEQKRGLRE